MKNLLLIFFLSIGYNSIGQNIEMTYKAPQILNPAFTGVNDFGSINLLGNLNRYNWLNRFTSYVGYNAYVPVLKGGIGGYNYNYSFDFSDIMNINRTGLNYAFQSDIGEKWSFSLGVGVDFMSYKSFIFQCNETVCVEEPVNFNIINVSSGGLFYSKHLYFAFAVNQIRNVLFDRQKYSINTGYYFELPNIEDFSFNVSLEYLNGIYDLGNLSINSMFNYKLFYLGLKWFNFDYEGAVQLGANLKRYSLNYSLWASQSMFSIQKHIVFRNEIALQIKLPQTINRQSKGFNHLLF